jgi:hypothetical protein
MLSCYNLGWLKRIFCNMMKVDHENFGDIHIYIYIHIYIISVCVLMVNNKII